MAKSDRFSSATMQLDRVTLADRFKKADNKRQACLVFVGGVETGKVVPIDRSNIVFGRDEICDVVLQDDGISRQHIRVSRRGDEELLLRDLGSTNGTFVAGRQVREIALRPGDKVLVGRRTILKFELHDEIDLTYQRRIYESSTKDGLTGAFNRNHFDQRMLADLSFTRRHGLPLSLLLFDLDFFKSINDSYGHPAGDAVLVEVARVIHAMIRAEDVFARYGGEEFAIIASGIDGPGAMSFAERVRDAVASCETVSPEHPGTTLKITVSIGVATLPQDSSANSTSTVAPDILINAADRNLYQAKELGRDRVVGSVL